MMKEKHFELSTDIPQMEYLYQNLLSRGKALRAQMTCQVADCLKIDREKRNKLARIVEYIHQSSILHDDVIDASPIRRGSLSAWMQFSIKKSVLAGDYLLAQAAEDTAELENTALMKFTASILKDLVKGEWMQSDLKNRENLLELEKVHELKTASLFKWSLRAPFLVAKRYEQNLHRHLNRIGVLLGALFQRADDLLDFDIRNQENKTVFKDMEEGFFNSFAVCLCQGGEKPFKAALRACRSLKEVKHLTGEKKIEDTLKAFDEKSRHLITAGQGEIENLKAQLFEEEKPLLDKLKTWPARFYWRA